MRKKPATTPKSMAKNLATASNTSLPRILDTYLDDLDASADGRGWDYDHQKTADYVINAVRYATIRRDALQTIADYPTDAETSLTTAIDGMKKLAKAALR